eukprot:Awhi_evm1s10735
MKNSFCSSFLLSLCLLALVTEHTLAADQKCQDYFDSRSSTVCSKTNNKTRKSNEFQCNGSCSLQECCKDNDDDDDNDTKFIYKLLGEGYCRRGSTGSAGMGKEGSDYDLYDNVSEEECRRKCNERKQCKAYEIDADGKCEIWVKKPDRFRPVSGVVCKLRKIAP